MSRSLLLLTLLVSLATPAVAAESSLGGRIIDRTSQRPVADASVSVLVRGQEIARTTTDVTGGYRLSGLDEGLVAVIVDKPGYLTAAQADVRLIRGKTATSDLELGRAGAISEEIVVVASGPSDDAREPVNTIAYDREAIRRNPGTSGDVLRSLDSLPGVTATGEFTSYSVRGRGPRDNLILVDEIPFDKVVHFDQAIGEQEDLDGGGRFSIFAPNLIDEATFQPGGFRAAYGGKNGSLLRLRVAEGNPSTATWSGRVGITGWELNYDGPSVAFGNTSLLVSARQRDFGRIFELIGEEQIGAPRLADFILKSVTELDERNRFELLAIYSPEKYERDLDDLLASDEFEDFSVSTSEQDSTLFGATWRRLLGAEGVLRNAFYLRWSDKRSIQGEAEFELTADGGAPPRDEISVRPEILDLAERETELGWRGDVDLVTSGGSIVSFGARVNWIDLDFSTSLDGDWTRYVYDQDDFRPDPAQKFIVLTPGRVDSTLRADDVRAAAYAEYSWKLGDRVTLTPALRWDREAFTDHSTWSPRAALSVDLDARTRLNVAGGIYYQAPRYLDIAADPDNRELRSEKSTQVVVGLSRYLGQDLRLSGEAYYQDLDDLFVGGDRTSGRATSTGTGHTAGLDLILSKRLIGRWYAQANYSYAVSKRDDNLGDGEFDADFNRPHVFNALLSYEFTDSLALSLKWRYASGRPSDEFIIHEDVLGDPSRLRYAKEITRRNTTRLDDFHTLNLRVDYRKRFGPVSLIAFLDFINVYNHQNVDSLQWLEREGRNVEGGLSAFPTFGIKFEF